MSDMNLDLSVFGNKSSYASIAKPKAVRADPSTKEDSDQMNIDLVQWAVYGHNTYKPVSSTFKALSKGIYNILMTQSGIVFQKKSVCVDDLLRFPDSLSDKILNEIIKFWSKGDKFKEHGFLHRRGYLLHGPAGSGKTCLVQQIIANIIESNGLIFQCTSHPSVFNEGLALFRKVEPDRHVVCLFEDIDAIIDEYGEDEILTLLDGESQIDKVLNIATTNYPEKLDKRLVARPRRFDRVIEIGMPVNEVRRMYFEKKLNVVDTELNKWIKATEGFSFAACAELVISVCCFDKPFDEAVDILKSMMKASLNSYKYNDKVDSDDVVGFKPKKLIE